MVFTRICQSLIHQVYLIVGHNQLWTTVNFCWGLMGRERDDSLLTVGCGFVCTYSSTPPLECGSITPFSTLMRKLPTVDWQGRLMGSTGEFQGRQQGALTGWQEGTSASPSYRGKLLVMGEYCKGEVIFIKVLVTKWFISIFSALCIYFKMWVIMNDGFICEVYQKVGTLYVYPGIMDTWLIDIYQRG